MPTGLLLWGLEGHGSAIAVLHASLRRAMDWLLLTVSIQSFGEQPAACRAPGAGECMQGRMHASTASAKACIFAEWARTSHRPVDQDVEAAHLLDGLVHGALAVRDLAQVRCHRKGLCAKHEAWGYHPPRLHSPPSLQQHALQHPGAYEPRFSRTA